MLVTIIRKEIRENLVSSRYLLVACVTVILVALSFLVMHRDYLGRLERYEDQLSSVNKSSLLLPPAPLSILAKGMDESICQVYGVSAMGVGGGGSEQSLNILFRLFDTPDLAYITKIILSLCAMIVSFRLVSEEKESRTLALTLSHSLSRSSFLIGKWLSGLAGLILPFLLAVLTGVLLLTYSPRFEMGTQGWLGLGLFLLSSVLYLTFFFSLGLLISCMVVRSSSALVVSLFLWVLLVFVLPGLGGASAAAIADIPSSQSQNLRENLAWKKQYFEQMQIDGGYGSPKAYPERDNLVSDYRVRLNRQIELARTITRVSPPAVYTFLATDFAGTGIHERLRLKQALMNLQVQMKDSGSSGAAASQGISYTRSAIREVLTRTGFVNLLILMLQNAVVFAGAYVAFLRYDVR